MKLIYALLLIIALPLLTACSSDDAVGNDDTTPQQGRKISVHLRLSQAGTNAMRWVDGNATDDEMMKAWTVVAVHNSGENVNKVAAIYTCKYSSEPEPTKEVDIVAELPQAGSYRFYSFANIDVAELNRLLFNNSNVIPNPRFNDEVEEVEEVLKKNLTLTEEKANSLTIGINGNNFDPNSGIPMSNVQTVTVDNTTTNVNLIVVRMLAKIKLQMYNEGVNSLTVKSITLTDITQNGNNNLKLFPKYTDENNANKMEATHGDIQPNLGTEATTGEFTVKLTENNTVRAKSNSPTEFVFYVNESNTPENEFKHFYLKLELEKSSGNSGDRVTVNTERYALIDDKRNDGGEVTERWDYIARNDYRIIPIVLDDYKLELIPYDFPAIGVYPASVKDEDGLYTITFHDYGHFHLLPKVTKLTGTTNTGFADVPFGGPDYPHWQFVDNDKGFASSWTSWTDHNKTSVYDNAITSFYRQGNNDDKDGDDAGGVPVWYKNDGINGPQWKPDDESSYQPFIFGYIADPGSKPTNDKKVYHEFTINLYKNSTSAPRQMTYRLYMILDTDLMMYRSNGVAPIRHTHGH